MITVEDVMELENTRSLSNAFRDLRLCSLHYWPDAAALSPPGSHGPYVIIQTGIDPKDITGRVEDFILGRDGYWLSLGRFYQLPEESRIERFLYPTAADAIALLQTLTGPAKVSSNHLSSALTSDEGSLGDDPLNDAVAQARTAQGLLGAGTECDPGRPQGGNAAGRIPM